MNHEGAAYSVLGNYYAAQLSYQQMLELSESMGDRKGVGGAHINPVRSSKNKATI
ncbi:MAG: hypothetical protein IPO90_08550 [Flavobacteriales bacterium]|nr:hypothetical protein [Flavobacteriales bacterium]